MTAHLLPVSGWVADPSSRGAAGLTVERVCGQSGVTSQWASSPLKLLVPRPRGPSVWAYLSSFGGGMVAGDETSLDLQLGAGAVCFLGTQASTKIYRNPAGRPCGHRLRADLGSGSLLIAAPDPVQAFAGSQYTQHQEFDLAPDANLVLIDWLSSGRVARGERWAFRRFASRNEVRVGGARQWLDSLVLDHEQGPLEAGYRMGRYDCLALVYMTGPQVAEGAARWLAEVEAAPVTRLASLLCSASVHRNGHLFRLAGSSAEAVGQHMGRHLKFLSNLLHDDPWARKW